MLNDKIDNLLKMDNKSISTIGDNTKYSFTAYFA